MSKKILVLTASPMRDKPIDDLLAKELRAIGHEVWVRPCLREGRPAVLELEPDVVVVPPIRNPHSRDLVETLKSWGIGVVSRHTEASADWQDFKRLSVDRQGDILGRWTYIIDLEIVWGEDEAQILRGRGCPFPIQAVGSFSADGYKDRDILKQCIAKEVLYAKHKLNQKKKTILILSAWGFIDSSPDLQVDEHGSYSKDEQGRKHWLEMIEFVHAKLGNKFNILVTVHPNVKIGPYKEVLDPLGIPIDTELKAVHLVKNCHVVIHAGSTTAMGAHFLGKPAFQYGDQNQSGTWFDRSESAISHISPYAKNVKQLVKFIKDCKLNKSNASVDAIKNLEKGRYGNMDGQAHKRAAVLIDKINGKFRMCWPPSHRDYDQISILKNPAKIIEQRGCGVCKKMFVMVRPDWLGLMYDNLNLTEEQRKQTGILHNTCCPHCAARFYL